MKTWLTNEGHKILVLLLTLDAIWDRAWKLWERFKPLEDFVERRTHERRHTTMSISTIAEIVRYAVPVIETAVGQITTDAPVITQDIKDAIAVIEKSVGDIKNAVEALIAAEKTALGK